MATDNDLKRTYVFELNFDALMAVSVGYINYQPIPEIPGMYHDIALEVDRNLPAAEFVVNDSCTRWQYKRYTCL